MTIQQWRRDKARVKKAAELLANPFLKEMLETVIETHRLFHATPKTAVGLTDGDRSYLLGAVDGHNFAVASLKSLGELLVTKKPVEATYENPEQG